MVNLLILAAVIFIPRVWSPGRNTIVVLKVKYNSAFCAYSEEWHTECNGEGRIYMKCLQAGLAWHSTHCWHSIWREHLGAVLSQEQLLVWTGTSLSCRLYIEVSVKGIQYNIYELTCKLSLVTSSSRYILSSGPNAQSFTILLLVHSIWWTTQLGDTCKMGALTCL